MQLTSLLSRTGMKTAAERIGSCQLVDAAIGAVICGLAAIGATAVSAGHSWQSLVPLAFILVLLLVGGIFGARGGILGTILAGLIFASFLYSPIGRLSVASESARSNLGWMLLIGIAFSFLFAPPTSGFRRH